MNVFETIKNYVLDRTMSDSGDQLTTWIIILGVMSLIAIAVLLLVGDAIMTLGEDTADEISNAGSHLGG